MLVPPGCCWSAQTHKCLLLDISALDMLSYNIINRGIMDWFCKKNETTDHSSVWIMFQLHAVQTGRLWIDNSNICRAPDTKLLHDSTRNALKKTTVRWHSPRLILRLRNWIRAAVRRTGMGSVASSERRSHTATGRVLPVHSGSGPLTGGFFGRFFRNFGESSILIKTMPFLSLKRTLIQT